MTKHFLLLILFLPLTFFSQSKLDGLWQGILIQNGSDRSNSHPFFLEVTTSNGRTSGRTREEIYNTDLYAIGKQYSEIKENTLEFKLVAYSKKKGDSRTSWCKLKGLLIYNESTGYLEGKYSSSDCRTNAGTMVLFRTKKEFNEEDQIASHSSRDGLIEDLKKGLDAPEIRELNRKNFVFQPIYFDYDKSEIRAEYFDFLSRIVQVVNGHSDLRVKVSGNTDADGTDEYNDSLSKRRAEAILYFFVKNGIEEDRIEIQFNGEKKPVDRNDTQDGKQRNRRVEFEFI